MIVKIGPLLAHYLYINKQLDLPGIGTFLLDNHLSVDSDQSKSSKPIILEGVQFQSNTTLKIANPHLIQFIATHSGRIIPLATADLDSYLGLAIQFINIGKPYVIEGIGTISKVNSGGLSYEPGYVMTEKLNELVIRDNDSSTKRGTDDNYQNLFNQKNEASDWKKPMIIILILAGLGLAIWGGYIVYKKTTHSNANTVVTNVVDTVVTPAPVEVIIVDSLSGRPITLDSSARKFIIETADINRAKQRMAKLKSYQWNVQMETTDSIKYKLFLLIPASAQDTTRIKDSLFKLTGKKVFIE